MSLVPAIRSDIVLNADKVDLVRERRLLLDQVSMTVLTGEHWALLGPNGAGKSTLLGILGAYNHPTRGTAEILGHRMGRVDVHALRPLIGQVNPRHPLESARTVREIVLTGATGTIELVPRWTPTEEQLRRADELIELMGLDRIAESRWPALSQGERGRTLIARALMPEPLLLLLDEPATGLDLAARERLLAALDEIRARQPELTTVLVTHHLEELPATTSHALLLREGRVLAAGPADEVLTTDLVSACFDHPVAIVRNHGRWAATAAPA
ncbi:ATP-binding cassette domain-containing protein [Actinomadura barringtoniae]|uniref:ATP-binding cassette domain-containing protein n=1 Tax=Actinomadura barringtoniae TaxID=1427535 RepID=A0A939PB78_9ACTN|nr:ATP-binding cassette domain-containing protein [Actinomadura barringtoniae]MBO2449390.1 ATP-binding cassette domain-containing protein [Actinomadura barringtoniae]